MNVLSLKYHAIGQYFFLSALLIVDCSENVIMGLHSDWSGYYWCLHSIHLGQEWLESSDFRTGLAYNSQWNFECYMPEQMFIANHCMNIRLMVLPLLNTEYKSSSFIQNNHSVYLTII